MRQPAALRFAVTLAVSAASVALGIAAGCGPDTSTFWVCHNPITGNDDGSIFDSEHFVNGVADPCHCFDLCGPQKTCPIAVDAGEPGAGCDAGAGDGGP